MTGNHKTSTRKCAFAHFFQSCVWRVSSCPFFWLRSFPVFREIYFFQIHLTSLSLPKYLTLEWISKLGNVYDNCLRGRFVLSFSRLRHDCTTNFPSHIHIHSNKWFLFPQWFNLVSLQSSLLPFLWLRFSLLPTIFSRSESTRTKLWTTAEDPWLTEPRTLESGSPS